MTRRDGDVGDLADQSTPFARSREADCLRRATVDAKRSDGVSIAVMGIRASIELMAEMASHGLLKLLKLRKMKNEK